MPIASEVNTTQEKLQSGSVRIKSRVKTNAGEKQFLGRLVHPGLFEKVETIQHYQTNWHWTGTGQGYEILWLDTTTLTDLILLARL